MIEKSMREDISDFVKNAGVNLEIVLRGKPTVVNKGEVRMADFEVVLRSTTNNEEGFWVAEHHYPELYKLIHAKYLDPTEGKGKLDPVPTKTGKADYK